MMDNVDLVLASGSPRRSEILRQLGIKFRVIVSGEEEKPSCSDLLELPRMNAEIKALSVSKMDPYAVVLGFDTLVFVDGAPLGKPRNEAHALEMLKKLNHREHWVITGVAVARGGKILASSSEKTEVFFRDCSLQELQDYVNSKDPLDKAGAYGIQTNGARLIKSIKGCYYNVVGLPVACTLEMLDRVGIKV